MLRVDDPRLEPRTLNELTQNEMAEDAESDIAIRLVDENDYRAKRTLKKNHPFSLVES